MVRALVMVALRQAAAGCRSGPARRNCSRRPTGTPPATAWGRADRPAGRAAQAGGRPRRRPGTPCLPALRETGDLERVSEGIARLLREGTGAHRQRRALHAGGFPALLDLLASEADGDVRYAR
ncbi:hypothetical protein NKH77_07820 [Streptomyces sp. M19]